MRKERERERCHIVELSCDWQLAREHLPRLPSISIGAGGRRQGPLNGTSEWHFSLSPTEVPKQLGPVGSTIFLQTAERLLRFMSFRW